MQSKNAIKMDSETDDGEMIELSKDFTSLLQAGDKAQANAVFYEICKLNDMKRVENENTLYDEVGKLTRELHDNVNKFVNDSKIQTVADEEMPDARQRLEHVVTLTERSAHKTMTLIEHSLPMIKMLSEEVELFKEKINDDAMDDNSQSLTENMTDMLDFVAATIKDIASDLNGIMMAQDYQDLTGQIIQRVSKLVQNVEDNLVSLLKITDGSPISPNTHKKDNGDEPKKDSSGFGPAVPGVNHGEVMQSQDEVDDLLSSLGF